MPSVFLTVIYIRNSCFVAEKSINLYTFDYTIHILLSILCYTLGRPKELLVKAHPFPTDEQKIIYIKIILIEQKKKISTKITNLTVSCTIQKRKKIQTRSERHRDFYAHRDVYRTRTNGFESNFLTFSHATLKKRLL